MSASSLVRNNHRWTRLLTQQSSFTVYRLPTKENKLPGSWCFPLVPFSVYTHIYTENGTNGKRNVYIYGSLPFPLVCCKQKTKRQIIHMPPFQTENGIPGDFSKSVYRLLILQTEVCGLSVCWRRNKRKLSVCKETKRTCPIYGNNILKFTSQE